MKMILAKRHIALVYDSLTIRYTNNAHMYVLIYFVICCILIAVDDDDDNAVADERYIRDVQNVDIKWCIWCSRRRLSKEEIKISWYIFILASSVTLYFLFFCSSRLVLVGWLVLWLFGWLVIIRDMNILFGFFPFAFADYFFSS